MWALYFLKKQVITVIMMVPTEDDYLKIYENAVLELETAPNDRNLQYRAVLALARMGSPDFALSEYERYDLSNLRHHEDIMALGGRLSKDLYLTTTGQTATQHALNSAQQYEAAYQDTQGYYSGINSATMALLGGMPEEVVKDRARLIKKTLPATKNLTPTDYYFIEASRAESFLLLGDEESAHKSLRRAIEFDPLNYTAHAATLKQFRLILKKQKTTLNWLKEFSPPRPMHFAGHIWEDDKRPRLPDYSTLLTQISDAIQHNDIGYAYGSLAAGADIVIAETLIQEGAQLHIILPSDEESFIAHSVRPFGKVWVERFMTCMKHAKSVKILDPRNSRPRRDLDLLAGDMAMGQAIMKGDQLDVPATQLLILDETVSGSMTATHAQRWQKNNLEQNIIPIAVNLVKKPNDKPRVKAKSIPIKMARSDTREIQTFASLRTAIETSITKLEKDQTKTFALHYALDDNTAILDALTANPLPNSILISDPIAASIMLIDSNDLNVIYAGLMKTKNAQAFHFYNLRRIS